MKPNKQIFWMIISIIYLVFLLIFICIHNPDFLKIENCLLLVPVYIPIFISLYVKHKNDECASSHIWGTKWSLIIITAIVVVFKIIVNYFK